MCVQSIFVQLLQTSDVYHNSCTGWRRLIGPPKLQIICHKRATKYRSLFREMTYTDKGSYGSSPPCMTCRVWHRVYHISCITWVYHIECMTASVSHRVYHIECITYSVWHLVYHISLAMLALIILSPLAHSLFLRFVCGQRIRNISDFWVSGHSQLREHTHHQEDSCRGTVPL